MTYFYFFYPFLYKKKNLRIKNRIIISSIFPGSSQRKPKRKSTFKKNIQALSDMRKKTQRKSKRKFTFGERGKIRKIIDSQALNPIFANLSYQWVLHEIKRCFLFH